MIKRFISRGQTTADQAVLDFHIKMDLAHGKREVTLNETRP